MGKVYGGRWELVDSVGCGGQGEVFLCRDTTGVIVEQCVLKRVLNHKRRARFDAEVLACKSLSHPNIAKVLDHSALELSHDDTSRMYIVMPYAEKGNLEQRVALYKDSLDSTLKVALALAEALQYAHSSGVIHRDVKPANILFGKEDHDCILSDFGICLIRGTDRATEMGEVVGPRAFMAPELEGGGQLQVTPTCDVYSLGKVVYFMLSGGVVLPRERHREPGFDICSGKGMRYELIGRLLDRTICDAKQRISMNSVIDELRRIQAWDANTALLSPSASTVLGSFLKRQREALSVEEANRVIQEKKAHLLNVYRSGVLSWLDDVLSEIARALSHEGVLQAGLLTDAEVGLLGAKANPKDRIGHHGDYAHFECGRGLGISTVRGMPHRAQVLFGVYAVRRVVMRMGAAAVPVADNDQSVIFLPYFWESDHMSGYFTTRTRQRGSKYEAMRKSFIGPSQTLLLISNVGSWPEAVDQYKAVVDGALESALEFIDNFARTGTSSMGS